MIRYFGFFTRLRISVVLAAVPVLPGMIFGGPSFAGVPTPMTDTGQTACYGNTGPIRCPGPDARFYGQDANYSAAPMAYRDNGDGTVTDLITGLMWSRAVDAGKVSLEEARDTASAMTLGGYTDWRVPNIKELYSLINFSGSTGNTRPVSSGAGPSSAVPYINTDYFNFKYGKVDRGERYIDAQWLSSTRYVSYTMDRNPTLFGVNFADGRIKGYGTGSRGPRGEKKFYVRFVRGDAYGENNFMENGDGTVTDLNTGLTWMQADSGRVMTWEEALAYAESAAHAGLDDWRLPDAKELQYIVDYTRSPDTSGSAAIDPVFSATSVTNEAGQRDFAHYWTSTSHLDGRRPGDSAVTVCFGRAMGQMRGRTMDVHGAGAQRSDPKTGRSAIGHGPQGDARRVKNMVRLVRGGRVTAANPLPAADPDRYPHKVRIDPGYEAKTGGRLTGQGHGSGTRPGFVSRLDRDNDNRVSWSEFDGPSRHFSKLDRNNDGYLTEDEAPQGPPSGGRRPRPEQ